MILSIVLTAAPPEPIKTERILAYHAMRVARLALAHTIIIVALVRTEKKLTIQVL